VKREYVPEASMKAGPQSITARGVIEAAPVLKVSA
jgi:hypothetical protein